MTPQSGSRIDPPPAAPARLATQREKILALLADAPDVAFIRHRGNIGDDLIHASTRRPMRRSRPTGRT